MAQRSRSDRYSSRNPDPVDVAVGARIKFLRVASGYSQEQVGKALGITFQQMQKYESGKNRCAPSRLTVMAKMFKVSMAAFFEDKHTSNGKGLDYATLLATRDRQMIFERLVKLDDGRVERAVLDLLNRMSV